ncbi:MAG: aminotransferase class I/II-fold pyridoxal phosphate-dependent enzyme [Candidatus Gastranaerophilales bacterium]|nr:aminotransferase class I/II-fold pyridoxal phosphate-dependent enzyme [Candidatus Gastranaerophilales bacterium]
MNTVKKVKITPADKVLNLEKYIFVELDELKAQARKRGIDLIDLGIGNPDRPTADYIVKETIKSIKNPKNHGYPNFRGKDEFQVAIKEWMAKRYDVKLDDDFIAQAVNGGKEGIAHATLAFTNPGDINIIPDPYYPVFSRATKVACGEVYYVPLSEENDFLPDLNSIPQEIAQKAKIFIINYPNNPTGAVVTKEFLEDLVKFCRENEILIISDLAYGEICYDGYRALSIFSIEGAKDVALEIHTCSKTFNMAGWRVGFVLGKKEFIDTVFAMKINFDYGTSTIMQDAAIAAMRMPYKYVEATMKKYQQRRDYLVKELRELGWHVRMPKATMYLWIKVPEGMSSREFCTMVMDKTGVVFTPGIAFGAGSEGYVRVSLVQDEKKLREAVKRLKEAGIRYK